MPTPTVFVCGITGTQGSAVAQALKIHNTKIHSVARKPSSSSAVAAVSSFDARLFPGDYANEDALRDAIAGCSAVFINLSPDFIDPGAEIRYAKSIMSIARDAGVQHVVYSSALSADEPERLPLSDPQSFIFKMLLSKQAIEKEVRDAGFKYWTILRPGSFMANYIQPLVSTSPGLVEHGRLSTPLQPDTVLPLVDVATIGNFVSAAIFSPEKFHAQEINLTDELMPLRDLLPKLSSAAGRNLEGVYLSDEEIKEQSKTDPMMFARYVMRDLGIFADVEKVKSWGVPLSSFDAFLEREKTRVLETYAATP